MSLTLFLFLVVFGFAFLGQHQAGADCGADLWKDDEDLSEGSCSRPSLSNTKDDDDPVYSIEDDPYIKASTIPKEKPSESQTEVQEPFFQTIVKIFKFLWQVMSIWINFNK
nr:uncharacterized protein LOC108059666 [Drosophila takahashii]